MVEGRHNNKAVRDKPTGKSNPHRSYESSCSGTNKVAPYFQKRGNINEETKRAELMITTYIVDHNIPFRVMDHLS